MGDSSGQYQKLPPGWDTKYDQATGNCYYINYFTKAMQLEDPRMRYRQLQNERCSTESIPLQHPLHGSPYHVYPSNNLPAARAFQMGPATNSSSPLLSSRAHLEMSPLPFPKSSLAHTPRLPNMSRRSTIQETSFSNPIDTDAVVAKIQNMFPTASENHIRLLLKKYYNREAVVISALQVEKHPVTMPGPFVTPPAQRHLYHSNTVFHMTPPARRLDIGLTSRGHGLHGLHGGSAGAHAGIFGSGTSRTASPVPGGRFGSVMSMHSGRGGDEGSAGSSGGYGYVPSLPYHHGSPHFGTEWRSSPKPHSSPKMKLRYMKNIFPKADEMLLLDILAGADNNVQKASEKLISMGYTKRDFSAAPKVSNRPTAEQAERARKKSEDERIIPLRPKEYTQAEKEAMQARLKEKYAQIADRIILMALESVNYSEDRALQILQIVQEEDETRAAKKQTPDLQTTTDQLETETDGAVLSQSGATVDNIITVVVETTPSKTNDIPDDATHAQVSSCSTTKIGIGAKKRSFPSINVTTPTTATTQIILSNSPICIGNETQPTADFQTTSHTTNTTAPLSAASTLSPRSSPTPPSLPQALPPSSSTTNASINTSPSYQKLTTKNILARSSNSNVIGSSDSYCNGSQHFSATNSASILEKLKLSRPRDKSDSLKHSQRDSIEEEPETVQHQEFQSLLGRIATLGHNTELVKGPDENLLLADYVTWNGANPDISTGHKQVALGPDPSMLTERTYTPLGRNPNLCKGAKAGLAKGSIYAQLSAGSGTSAANIKCN